MTDPAPLARIANASARRALLSLLGPPTSTPGTSRPENETDTYIINAADLLREERQELSNIWKETTTDSAGVGLLVNLTGERDSESHKILNFGQRNSVDDELLRQRVLGLKNKSKTGRRFVGPRTSGPGNRDRSIVKSGNAGLSAVDSSEEEGRSALGKSRLPKENKARRKAKRVVRVETFAGMLQQQVRIEAGDDEDHDVVVPERYSQSEARNGRSRPHSFLDELLEAKKNKQRRKKRRKTQKNNEREALSNEEDDI